MDVDLAVLAHLVLGLVVDERGVFGDELVDEVGEQVYQVFVLLLLHRYFVEKLLVLLPDVVKLVLGLQLFTFVVHDPPLQKVSQIRFSAFILILLLSNG